MKIFSKHFSKRAFTLVEVLLVVAIIGLFASILVINSDDARERARVTVAVSDARALKMATVLYHHDMEFFPPDVNRGWDPGFVYSFPNNPDTGEVNKNVSCGHCPPNWQKVVEANWDGPYIGRWPRLTPWEGKYDYNYWGSWTTRYGCYVPAGIYGGVQRDYNEENPITPLAEQIMVNQGHDYDGCVNGESQMILFPL